ncbi:MAG: hypothetical protein LBJ31_01320 [Treponema sp.]|jgi:hypothetical protein|nr:hypothetical protein [Treponema sp.]
MELRILEIFAAVFLFLSIIRPLVRDLWKLDGIAALPLFAFALVIGSFAAYDFRPECVPLALFAFFLIFANMPDFISLFARRQSDMYLDRSLVFTLASAVICVFVVWIAILFAPPMDRELSSAGVETMVLRDYGRDSSLTLRIYGPLPREAAEAGEQHPLIIVVPPIAGSIQTVDQLCLSLRARGFSVLSYSRPGFDSPAITAQGEPVRLGFLGMYRLANALWRGQKDVKANEGGRELEAERGADVTLLLRELRENQNLQSKFHDTDLNTLVLAGYGAGGAAITVLAADSAFVERFSAVRCVIALEAPVLSALEGDAGPPVERYTGAAGELYNQVRDFIEDHTPRKITHINTVPQSKIPLLLVVSGQIIHQRSGRYETVLRVLSASKAPSLLAAFPGAGPFDYSDSPRVYPIYSFLFGGDEKNVSPAGPEPTASLITNFASAVLGGEALSAGPSAGEVYTEAGGSWETLPQL